MTLTRSVAGEFVRRHPEGAAQTLGDAPPDEAVEVLATLDPQDAARLLPLMPPRGASRCLSGLSPERAASLLERLPARLAAALLRSTGGGLRDAVLKTMSYVKRSRLESHLQYPPGSVGERMETDLPAVPAHWPLKQLRGKLRNASEDAGEDAGEWIIRVPYLYVVDGHGGLVGVLRLPPRDGGDDTPVRDVMTSPVQSLYAFTPIEGVSDHPAWAVHDRLPVTTTGNVLVGVLRHRDLRSQPQSDAAGTGTPLADALMTISELYWKGLWSTIDGLAGPAGTHEGRPDDTGGAPR